MDALDKERWIALSPLLDQLLDRDEEDRQRWLAQLRAHDAATADELEALLARDLALSEQGFMGKPAAEQLAGPGGSAPAMREDELVTPDLTGQSIGPYQLEREVGQGGMGAVWLARRADGRFSGEVAIKFLKAGLFGKGDSGRFAREGQILGRLSHPHIARLLDAGVHQGQQPYLVLEYVDGLPIDRYCHVQGLDIEARIRLFLDVLAAVAHAHQRLILHRDLKPSNILVTADGQVKLLDFGIAKLMDDATQPAAATELTQLAGSAFTPQYAAPEQIQQGDVTTATDVYALGVLLYQLLGGRHPTADDTQTHLDRLKAVVELVPKRLSEVAAGQLDPVIARQARLLKGDLDTIVAKALKKVPGDRYANAEQFAADLNRWLAHEPITARRDTRLYVMSRFVRRHRVAVGASSLAVLALLGLTALSVLQAHRAEQAEHVAQQRRQQADDLLSFMLGEFADKLRPIGRLELLDSVGARAMRYLSQNENISATERLQRAKALTVLGEVRVSKRDLEGALQPLEASQRLLAGSPPPDVPADDWYKAQGAAAFWEGHTHFSNRQFEKASASWIKYQKACETWLQTKPAEPEALLELSYAENSLGSARLEISDLAGAAERFRRSIELKKQALARKSGNDDSLRVDLADSMSWLGTTLQWQGDYAESFEIFQRAIQILKEVRSGHPGNGAWDYREAVLHRWAGLSAMLMQEATTATEHLQQSVDMLKALQSQDPTNLNWQMNLLQSESLHLESIAGTLTTQARLARWNALQEKSELIERGAAPGTQRRRIEHQSRILTGLAAALAESGKPEQALAVLQPIEAIELDGLNKRPDDIRLLMSYIELAAMKSRLTAVIPALGDNARLQICREQVDRIEKMRGLIGVHQLITARWIEAQSCLGRGNRDDVQAAAKWLRRHRSTVPSVPQATQSTI